MTLPFADSAQSTLGIEWELALVDAVSGELRSEAPDLLRALHVAEGLADDDVNPHMTSELLQNTVELVTGVHERVDAATADLGRIAARVADAAAARGISLFCQGTHPFADAIAQPSTPSERYDRMLDLTQYWGRQLLIFGVHVHVGLDDVSKAMPVVNGLVNRVPHLLALSASSPFWAGTDTGYQSQRTLLFQQLPTAGLPFQFQEWEGFERCVAQMEQVGMIADVTECRWDVRAVPRLGTVEMRACDGLATLEEIAAVTAYTQCLVDDLSASLERGETVEVLPPWHVQENKWRAARYGMDATVIVDARGTQVPLAEHLPAEIERLTPVAERLGCAAELAGVQAMIDDGGAAARQRRVEAQALAGPPAAGEDTDDAVARCARSCWTPPPAPARRWTASPAERPPPARWRPCRASRLPPARPARLGSRHASTHMAGKAQRRRRGRPGSADPGADGRDHRGHFDRHLRVGPASVRGPGAVHGRGGRDRPRADGHRPRGRVRGHPHPAR